eukprot:11188840-Lingulodinium_polyedra.AAC.1
MPRFSRGGRAGQGEDQCWTCVRRDGPQGTIRGCGYSNLAFHRWCDRCCEWRFPLANQPAAPRPAPQARPLSPAWGQQRNQRQQPADPELKARKWMEQLLGNDHVVTKLLATRCAEQHDQALQAKPPPQRLAGLQAATRQAEKRHKQASDARERVQQKSVDFEAATLQRRAELLEEFDKAKSVEEEAKLALAARKGQESACGLVVTLGNDDKELISQQLCD